VAFCPSTPLLVPAVAGRATADLAELRSACADALAAALSDAPDVVVVVGSGGAPGVRYGAGDGGTLRGFGVDLDIPFDGRRRPDGRLVPLAHTVGAWLLDEAGWSGNRLGVGAGDLAAVLAGLPAPVAVLAVGDGSARRTLKAPGYLDDAAGPFDASVAAALSAGDPGALAGLDAGEGRRLLADGVGAWQAVGAVLEGRSVAGRLRYDAAPYGVGYLVADWVAA
jgi:hypothetical protein